jgi:HPt (histidine-containing phosphotransfer) domain-containing protein
LWQILLKYLEPISSELISGDIGEYDDKEQQRMIRSNFYKNNQNVHTEIEDAVSAGDTKLAHRLAHTLKGNAGLVGKTGLRHAASEVETLLRDGSASIWENKMKILKTELMLALDEFKPLSEENQELDETQMLDAEQTLSLFDKLGPMLENSNPECVDLLNTICAIPGAEALVQQIENYNFKEAFRTLLVLKAKLEKADE